MTGSDDARPAASEPRVPDTIECLVVPLDGSDFSLPARPAATRPAVRLGAEVHLLSAVESVDQVDARDRELARIEVPGHVVHRTVVVGRDPAGAIHEAVRRLQNAVACMATHGRARSAALVGSVATNTRSQAGVRRLVLRSVAATIVRHSRSPVLVVPRPDGATRHER